MKKYIFLPAIICLLLVSLRTSSAQDTLRSKFGISFGMANNVQSADFSALPGIPGGSGNYTAGYGNGFAISLLYEYPIQEHLFIGARFGYIDHGATLAAPVQQTTLIVNRTPETGNYTRSIDLVASSYGLELQMGVHVMKGLILNAGLRIGFLTSPKFIQRETASQGGFADSSGKDSTGTIRNEHAGNLPGASSVVLHGIFSLGYEIPINPKHTTYIVPEITYTPAFNDIVKGITWKTNAVIYGIGMKFSLN